MTFTKNIHFEKEVEFLSNQGGWYKRLFHDFLLTLTTLCIAGNNCNT